jgi:hypothetical protein
LQWHQNIYGDKAAEHGDFLPEKKFIKSDKVERKHFEHNINLGSTYFLPTTTDEAAGLPMK